MQYISSRQNRWYKQWYRVAKAAGSARSEFVLLEGINLCSAWLLHYGAPDAVLLDESQKNDAAIKEFCASLPSAEIFVLHQGLFKSLSDVVSPQGVIFVVPKPIVDFPQRLRQTCVLLDQVQDPGNLGTILRTVAALEIDNVFLTTGTVSAWSPKVLRSAQGAHFLTNIHEQVDFNQWMQNLDIPLAITTLSPTAQSLYESELKGPIAWAFGNEGRGIEQRWQEMAKHQLNIPHSSQIESLNVAVAAAVCLFEHHRQLNFSQKNE